MSTTTIQAQSVSHSHFDTAPVEEVRAYIDQRQSKILPGTLKLHFYSRLRTTETEKHGKIYKTTKKIRRGLVIGYQDELGVGHVGWSLCSLADEFDRERAIAQAFEHSGPLYNFINADPVDVPRSLKSLVKTMLVRVFASIVHRSVQ